MSDITCQLQGSLVLILTLARRAAVFYLWARWADVQAAPLLSLWPSEEREHFGRGRDDTPIQQCSMCAVPFSGVPSISRGLLINSAVTEWKGAALTWAPSIPSGCRRGSAHHHHQFTLSPASWIPNQPQTLYRHEKNASWIISTGWEPAAKQGSPEVKVVLFFFFFFYCGGAPCWLLFVFFCGWGWQTNSSFYSCSVPSEFWEWWRWRTAQTPTITASWLSDGIKKLNYKVQCWNSNE